MVLTDELAERASQLVAETLGGTRPARDLAALAVARLKRRTEYEADAAGIRAAQRAGFDPRAWLELFDGPAARASNPLDDHPSPASRRARIEAFLSVSTRRRAAGSRPRAQRSGRRGRRRRPRPAPGRHLKPGGGR